MAQRNWGFFQKPISNPTRRIGSLGGAGADASPGARAQRAAPRHRARRRCRRPSRYPALRDLAREAVEDSAEGDEISGPDPTPPSLRPCRPCDRRETSSGQAAGRRTCRTACRLSDRRRRTAPGRPIRPRAARCAARADRAMTISPRFRLLRRSIAVIRPRRWRSTGISHVPGCAMNIGTPTGSAAPVKE
jgi:hypothetical protein